MDFSIQAERCNNVITVTVTGNNADVDEIKQEKLFGPVSVSVGGVFNGPPPFTLPSKTAQIRTDSSFKVVETFNGNINPQAAPQAQVYINEISSRIMTAKSQWDSLVDTVTGTEFSA